MVKRGFHSFLLTGIHLCDLCVLCGKKYRGGEVSTEEYRFNYLTILSWSREEPPAAYSVSSVYSVVRIVQQGTPRSTFLSILGIWKAWRTVLYLRNSETPRSESNIPYQNCRDGARPSQFGQRKRCPSRSPREGKDKRHAGHEARPRTAFQPLSWRVAPRLPGLTRLPGRTRMRPFGKCA